MKFLRQILAKLESWRPFSEVEAWNLFRWAALGEAVGWTLLLLGIAISHYRLPGQRYAVPIAGQIHGTIFLIYFGILAAVYSSLRWPRWKFMIGILAGIPPYGTLVFELWAAHQQRQAGTTTTHLTTVRAIIKQNHAVLAVQPRQGIHWQLPGGSVDPGETAADAIARHLHNLMGIAASKSALRSSPATNELYFDITLPQPLESSAFASILAANPQLDDIRFIDPAKATHIPTQFSAADIG